VAATKQGGVPMLTKRPLWRARWPPDLQQYALTVLLAVTSLSFAASQPIPGSISTLTTL
jgi:hypothetical protein